MSYGIMVFDPNAVPAERDEFLAWFDAQAEEEGLFDPRRSEFSTPGLRAWLEEMLTTFPAMDGPYTEADVDCDTPRLTEYSINRTYFYMCFGWSQADFAYDTVMTLAEKHGLGVYDISNPEGKIWRPGSDGKLR